jgi:hypothetical protein
VNPVPNQETRSRYKITLMASNQQQSGFLGGNGKPAAEPRSLAPWIIAGVVVLVALGALMFFGHRGSKANPGGAGLAPPDPYSAQLVLSDIKMSESSSMAGTKVTYLDGQVTNHGDKTVSGVTVQVAFRDFGKQLVQKETTPLNLIRTHEPYVDTQPVSANPIKPGEGREFRLIFDHVADSWNQEYPEVRVIEVTSR